MKNFIFNSSQVESQKISHYRFRLMSRLIVIFICTTLTGQRLGLAFANDDISDASKTTYILSIPFLFALCLVVLVEFLLYRKMAIRILKYSKFIDMAFSLVFTGEWLFSLNAQLFQSKDPNNFCYSLSAVVGFCAISWRTLLQLLITQQWQFKIIPPVAAYIYLMTFAVVHQPEQIIFILIRGTLQATYIILIFYFDHKINVMLLIGNVMQEQWLQLNEFILNNIPENIVILDLEGNCNFVCQHFKKILKSRYQSDDIEKFFQNITNLQQQQPDNENENEACDTHTLEMIPLKGFTTCASKCTIQDEDIKDEAQPIPSLQDLIAAFGGLIAQGNIKERCFQIFHGKFKQENDPQERSFEIKLSFVNHQPNKYILLILRDTTQRDLILSLEGNIKYKDYLLASVSHELRAPLNGNINLLEAAIKSNEISDQLKDNLIEPAVRSSKFLLHLINDILDMSQVKSQKLRLVFQQASLKETLTNAIQLVELHAKKKSLTLEIEIDSKLPATFSTDHMRLSQIVLNLVTNSIKCTQKGYVRISVWPLSNKDYVTVSVEDSGIGISEDHVKKIFKDFTQVDCKNGEKLNPMGVGLGLKIANDLAELLGPKGNTGIKVHSTLNKGSTFSFTIENKETGLKSLSNSKSQEPKEEISPLIPDEIHIAIESPVERKMNKRVSMKSLNRLTRNEIPSLTSITMCSCPKVLVVDDDLFNVMAYETILASLGVKYECVYNGRSAIDKMLMKVRYPCSSNCYLYKIVFMDEQMPGMTGKETVAEIINLQRQNLLPYMNIIGCTAHHEGEEIEEFLKCGIAEYIPKPISIDSIKKVLDKYEF